MRTKLKNAFREKDDLIKKQSDRIRELREENQALTAKLDAYRDREHDLIQTLDFARKKSEEYLASVRLQYAVECDRIGKFREKLNKYRSKEELVRAYDTTYRELREWQADLEKSMLTDLGAPMSDYLAERERLGDASPLPSQVPTPVRSDLYATDKITDEELEDLLDQI